MDTFDIEVVDKDSPDNEIQRLFDYFNEIKQLTDNSERFCIEDLLNNFKNREFATKESIFEQKLTQEYQKLSSDICDKIIKPENKELTQKFFNHCVEKCIKEEKPEFMLVIADLLPDLAKSHNCLVDNLIKQITYVKVPSKWCEKKTINFNSTNGNFWSYKFPDPKLSLSLFDRFVLFFLYIP
jgi:hypothetical protein